MGVARRQAALWPLMVLVTAIAAMAFILSFDALRTLGVACGIQPSLSWMFPLIIDAPVLAFTWATWMFKTRGLSQAYPWSMLILFSLVSLAGNALHAHPVETNGLLLPDWGASLLMTMPPVALLATSHMMVMAASRSFDMAEPEGEPTEPAEPDEPEPEAAPVGQSMTEPEAVPVEPTEPEATPVDPKLEVEPVEPTESKAAPTEPGPEAAPVEPEPEATPVEPTEPTEPETAPAPARREPDGIPEQWRNTFQHTTNNGIVELLHELDDDTELGGFFAPDH